MRSLQRLEQVAWWMVSVVLRSVGVLAWLRARSARRGEMFVLALHRVSAPGAGPEPLAMPHRAFEKLLRGLASRYQVVTIDQRAATDRDGARLPRAVLTFDDGYRDNADQAWPLLRKFGMAAHFFPNTGFIAGEPLWWEVVAAQHPGEHGANFGPTAEMEIARLKRIAHADLRQHVKVLRAKIDTTRGLSDAMSWDDIRRMSVEGAVFGGHGVEHAILPSCADHEVVAEIEDCVETLHREVGRPIETFAFPDNRYDERAREVFSRVGIRYAFADRIGPHSSTDDPFMIPRIPVSGSACSVAGTFSWTLLEARMLGAIPGLSRRARR